MKTKDFINEIVTLGFEVSASSNFIHVQNATETLCTVSKSHQHELDTVKGEFATVDKDRRDKLFDLVTRYSATPIHKRREEKKYLIKMTNEIITGKAMGEFLNQDNEDKNYLFASSVENKYYKTIFTEKEIKNLPDEVIELLPLCELLEITEDK